MPRTFLLTVLLGVSLVSSAVAQQATGKDAEEAKAEVMKLEKEKVPLLLKGGSAFADWFDRVDAQDVVIINGDGSSLTKAEQAGLWRSDAMRQTANDQRDHKAYVYDNGNVVIVTYLGTTHNVVRGKASVSTGRTADTWVRQDGKWLRVVHANSSLSRH